MSHNSQRGKEGTTNRKIRVREVKKSHPLFPGWKFCTLAWPFQLSDQRRTVATNNNWTIFGVYPCVRENFSLPHSSTSGRWDFYPPLREEAVNFVNNIKKHLGENKCRIKMRIKFIKIKQQATSPVQVKRFVGMGFW